MTNCEESVLIWFSRTIFRDCVMIFYASDLTLEYIYLEVINSWCFWCFLFLIKKIVPYVSYLALVTALGSEADYVLVPESPPPLDWVDRLCDKLAQASQQHIKSMPTYLLNNCGSLFSVWSDTVSFNMIVLPLFFLILIEFQLSFIRLKLSLIRYSVVVCFIIFFFFLVFTILWFFVFFCYFWY